MRDDELLAIYKGIRTLSEGMEARNQALDRSAASLDKSAAGVNAAIAELKQFPQAVGQQTLKAIASGAQKAVADNFQLPLHDAAEQAVRLPMSELAVTARKINAGLAEIKTNTRFHTLSYALGILAAGILLGFFLTYVFLVRRIDTLDNRMDGLQQQIAAPAVPQAVPEPPLASPKKHGRH